MPTGRRFLSLAEHHADDCRQYRTRCVLICKCGFKSEGEQWSEAGEALDEHLRRHAYGPQPDNSVLERR